MKRWISSALVMAAGLALLGAAPEERVSRPGEYRGYSAPRFDGYERSSFYIPMRDGTRLAADLFRPTRGGKVVDEKMPVVWMHTPYNRRTYRGGPAVENYPGYALRLVEYGYNVAVVDYRGLYASFGRNTGFNRGEWVDAARMDAYDVTEWFAKQPWSNGRIGMWGCSATGGSQMQAATTAPPSLKAIFPMSCEFDVYPFGVAGGMARGEGPTSVPPPGPDVNRDRGAAPVDGPDGARLLQAAHAEHARNIDNAGYVPFRDSVSPTLNDRWWLKSSPHTYYDTLRTSGIAIYAAANWNEAATRYGAFFTFMNLPRTKLILGPGTHCEWSFVRQETGFDIVVEELRFFDHWLRGVDNGVDREPAVTYYTYNAPKGREWRTSRTWPLANEKRTVFYLADGALASGRPAAGEDATTFGPAPQITSTVVTAPAGGLSYDTPVLTKDTEITGHPVVRLWLSAQAKDADVTAVLEDVGPDGKASTYTMVGLLRASRRAEAKAPYKTPARLPWHRHYEADAKPLTPNEPTEVAFDILPVSYIFKAGHRIRLRLTFSDPAGQSKAAVKVLHTPGKLSTVTLPVIPSAPG